MKTRYIWKETLLYFILFEIISNIWSSMSYVWYGKTKSIWMGSKHTYALTRGVKKNGMVPATTEDELDKIMQKHPEIKDVFIDVTERSLKRNSNYEQQEKDYSWKKKKHTMKHLLVTWDNNLILWASKSYEWSIHDYKILKHSWFMNSLLSVCIWMDLWFYWAMWEYPNHKIVMPYKKPKNKELSDKQKEENKTISWIRVIIENIIWWSKKYHVIVNRYRNKTEWNFRTVKKNMKNIIMAIVCWLYNFDKSKLFIKQFIA